MPAKIHPWWVERVLEVKARNPAWGEMRIQAALEIIDANGETDGGVKVPPEARRPPVGATIRRIVRDVWRPKPDAEKAQYLYLYWPESMERGDLPWEASAAALELLAVADASSDGTLTNPRPTIGLARWYWRVCQAAPDLPPPGKFDVAMTLFLIPGLGSSFRDAERPQLDIIEGWLAYAPWRNSFAADSYKRATSREKAPIPRYQSGEEMLIYWKASRRLEERFEEILRDPAAREAFTQALHAAQEMIGTWRIEEEGDGG